MLRRIVCAWTVTVAGAARAVTLNDRTAAAIQQRRRVHDTRRVRRSMEESLARRTCPESVDAVGCAGHARVQE